MASTAPCSLQRVALFVFAASVVRLSYLLLQSLRSHAFEFLELAPLRLDLALDRNLGRVRHGERERKWREEAGGAGCGLLLWLCVCVCGWLADWVECRRDACTAALDCNPA